MGLKFGREHLATDLLLRIAYAWVLLLNNKVTRRAVSTLYRVRSLALQPLSAGNSAEFSQAGNSKTIQPTEINLTSLDSLGSLE